MTNKVRFPIYMPKPTVGKFTDGHANPYHIMWRRRESSDTYINNIRIILEAQRRDDEWLRSSSGE
jgi:hypothetical protein